MMQALPVGDYTSEDVERFDWRSLPDDGPRGALLTVELDFPPERHDLWRSFPPVAVAKTTPTWDMFSPYQQQHWGDAERPANPTLLGTLEPVREYTCHYRMLKTLESIGVVVSRVHKVQSFRQERGLFDYVNKCTQMRIAEAARGKEKSDCKIGFFKLMANSLYGKMVENVRGRTDMRSVEQDSEKYLKLVKQPAFVNEIPVNADGSLLGVNMLTERVTFEKLIPIGCTVLDLSKTLMLDFWYKVIMPMYGPERARLLYTDTDSLVMEVTTEDVNHNFKETRLLTLLLTRLLEEASASETTADGRVRVATPADPEYDQLPTVAKRWLDCSKYPAPPKPDSKDPRTHCTPTATRSSTPPMPTSPAYSRTKAVVGRSLSSWGCGRRSTPTPSRTPGAWGVGRSRSGSSLPPMKRARTKRSPGLPRTWMPGTTTLSGSRRTSPRTCGRCRWRNSGGCYLAKWSPRRRRHC